MTATCNPYYQGLVVRATRLDACGAPDSGACGFAVSKGFIKVELETDDEDGEQIAPILADGTRCYNVTSARVLNALKAKIEFCEVDPELFNLLTGSTLVLDDEVSPVAHGFTVDSAVYSTENVALEIWTNLRLSTCVVGGTTRRWGYILFPWMYNGIVGQPTIENGAVNFTIEELMSRDNNQWGVGPYDIQLDAAGNPSPLYSALSTTAHQLVWKVNVAPPTSACGCQTLVPVT
jgi:hypothetical protein